MKIYAQHGSKEADRTIDGMHGSHIDGVVFSPKDISLERMKERLDYLRVYPSFDTYFDPQYYACFLASSGDVSLGNLIKGYSYFEARRKVQLESDKKVIEDITASLQFQKKLGINHYIAPGITIDRSFDSRDASIAKSFIRLAREAHSILDDKRKLYATLSISHSVLLNHSELHEFLDDLTVIDDKPDGLYVLVSASNSEARNEIFNPDVIASWMLINYAATLNGFEVVNGYSDILSPLLGAAGGTAGALGWSGTLRTFSMNRFKPSLQRGGGGQPAKRFFSVNLLNRLTHIELNLLRKEIPDILNGLLSDSFYSIEQASEPDRNQETFQSWDAIRDICNRLIVPDDCVTSLQNCIQRIEDAENLYLKISTITNLERKSSGAHLEPMREGIKTFAKLAELKL